MSLYELSTCALLWIEMIDVRARREKAEAKNFKMRLPAGMTIIFEYKHALMRLKNILAGVCVSTPSV